jgi:hypothetical protein
MSIDEKPGFLSRWSRRKLREETLRAPEEEAHSPVAREVLPDPAETTGEAEAEFDLSSLPAIDDLTAETDISRFFHKGVPDALRNAALSRIWRLDPYLQKPDILAEYAWDFNDPNSMIGFGALDAGIDQQAMLRQITGEKLPEEDGRAPSADPPEPVAETPVEPPAEAVTDATEGESEGDARPEEEGTGQSGPSGEDSAAVQHDHFEKIEEFPSPPRKARHGGALPS